jgi:hypothetical protein
MKTGVVILMVLALALLRLGMWAWNKADDYFTQKAKSKR